MPIVNQVAFKVLSLLVASSAFEKTTCLSSPKKRVHNFFHFKKASWYWSLKFSQPKRWLKRLQRDLPKPTQKFNKRPFWIVQTYLSLLKVLGVHLCWLIGWWPQNEKRTLLKVLQQRLTLRSSLESLTNAISILESNRPATTTTTLLLLPPKATCSLLPLENCEPSTRQRMWGDVFVYSEAFFLFRKGHRRPLTISQPSKWRD